MPNINKINTLEKALKSSFTPEALKPKLRAELNRLKFESDNIEKNIVIPEVKKSPKKKNASSHTSAVKLASKKYYLHKDIKFITVLQDGNKVTYKGSDVLEGATFLKDGGTISDYSDYYQVRNIVSVQMEDGTVDKPSNGYHIKKGSKPVMEIGGVLPDGSLISYKNLYLEKGGGIDKSKENYNKLFDRQIHLQELYMDEEDEILKEKYQKEIDEIGNTLHQIERKYENGGYLFNYKDKYIKEKIKKTSDVNEFLSYLLFTEKLGENFHPDDLISNYVNEMGKHLFTAKEAGTLEKYLSDAFDVSEKNNQDIYELGVDLMESHNAEFDLGTFLIEMYPKVKTSFTDETILQENYTIVRNGKKYTPTILFFAIEDRPDKLHVGYLDNELDSIGSIDFNLDKSTFNIKFPIWKITTSEKYEFGGHLKSAYTRERKYVNKSQDYEVRYAKGKNRHGYKLEKGGDIGLVAKGKTLQDIANQHDVSLAYITKQLERGTKVEMHHTTDPQIAEAIAKDHIWEDADTYAMAKEIYPYKENSKIIFKKDEVTDRIHKKKKYNMKGPKKEGSPIFAKAKEIRENGEMWTDAVKRAALTMKGEDIVGPIPKPR